MVAGMMERATLQVLAELAEIGLAEAVDVHVAAYDPIVRPLLRRRVRLAIAEAAQRTETGGSEHPLYLAFVLRHPDCPSPIDVNDERAVLAAYRKLSAPYTGIPIDQALRPRPGAYRASANPHGEPGPTAPRARSRRFWPITSPLVVALLATIVGAASWYAAPYLVPSAEDRFRKTAFGASLDEPLTDYVSEVGHGKEIDALPFKEELLAPAVEREIGAGAFTALGRAVDLLPQASASPIPSTDAAAAPLFDALNALNSELLEHGVPALLLGYAQGGAEARAVWITSYFVERRTELRFDGLPFRTAWGRRIDGLNLVDDVLYKADAEDWVVLSLERVEEELVKTLLGAMANGAPLGPTEYHPTDTSSRAQQARALGPLLAEEMAARAHVNPAEAERAFRAIKSRNDATLDLRTRGYSIEPSYALQLPPWLVRRVTRTRATRPADAPLIEDLLRMNTRMAIYRQSIAPAVDELASLEEEEFAGRLSYERLEDADASRPWAAGMTKAMRAVASSRLALLARPQGCPRLALWRVASLVYQPLSSADYEVGSALVRSLLEQLALPSDGSGAALDRMMRMPPERVRDAAQRAYRELFGRVPPVLTRKPL
jgi:hypothetical protein